MNGQRLQAVQMLVVATAGWALSFPTMKALQMIQPASVPDGGSWFVAASTLHVRFGFATLIMLTICARSLRAITRLELRQGLGLGVFASLGLLFQMDGLAYTSASTSAFLTQFYCLLIPIWVACRERRWPSRQVLLSCLLVIAGVAILSDFPFPLSNFRFPLSDIDWRHLRMGRGEIETLIGATIFTGQILWLQRPEFARNNVNHFTLIMFAVIMVAPLPVAALTGSAENWKALYRPGSVWLLMGILTLFCTLGAYLLMNYWQRFLSATQAGLLYCLEPVFASLFALFLPAWLSTLTGIQYANERVGLSLLVGGGLITTANVLMNLLPHAVPEPSAGAEPGRA